MYIRMFDSSGIITQLRNAWVRSLAEKYTPGTGTANGAKTIFRNFIINGGATFAIFSFGFCFYSNA